MFSSYRKTIKYILKLNTEFALLLNWTQNLHFCLTDPQCEVCVFVAILHIVFHTCLLHISCTVWDPFLLQQPCMQMQPQFSVMSVHSFSSMIRILCVSLWVLCTGHDETDSFFSLWDFPYSYVCTVSVTYHPTLLLMKFFSDCMSCYMLSYKHT